MQQGRLDLCLVFRGKRHAVAERTQHLLDAHQVHPRLAHQLQQFLGLLAETRIVRPQRRAGELDQPRNLLQKVGRQCRCCRAVRNNGFAVCRVCHRQHSKAGVFSQATRKIAAIGHQCVVHTVPIHLGHRILQQAALLLLPGGFRRELPRDTTQLRSRKRHNGGLTTEFTEYRLVILGRRRQLALHQMLQCFTGQLGYCLVNHLMSLYRSTQCWPRNRCTSATVRSASS